jgi:[NiFe] hydrogenase assembly HybE family chaperone
MARHSPCSARVAELVACFEHIAETRMRGLPIVHPLIRVEAVGFRSLDAESALGVLITPWFMNLVKLPRVAQCEPKGVGEKWLLPVGEQRIELIGAYEPGIGQFACSSLYSPLLQFVNHDVALLTAREAMTGLVRLGAFDREAGEPTARELSRRNFLRVGGGAGGAP